MRTFESIIVNKPKLGQLKSKICSHLVCESKQMETNQFIFNKKVKNTSN